MQLQLSYSTNVVFLWRYGWLLWQFLGYLKTVLNPSFLYKRDKMFFELRARRTGEKFVWCMCGSDFVRWCCWKNYSFVVLSLRQNYIILVFTRVKVACHNPTDRFIHCSWDARKFSASSTSRNMRYSVFRMLSEMLHEQAVAHELNYSMKRNNCL